VDFGPTFSLNAGGANLPKVSLKPRPIGLPNWSKLEIDWTHIIDSHTVGGKIFKQSKIKTPFPASWDQSAINKALSQAWENAQKIGSTNWGTTHLRGSTREGVPIEFWYDQAKRFIESAYIPGRSF
jgi:hypothetical protein